LYAKYYNEIGPLPTTSYPGNLKKPNGS